MNNKSYNQFCGLAYALDIVGERWTLLIIRELFAGPRRYTDLIGGLPGISTNLLSDRLRELEQRGLVCKRTLPPPAASTVYELTDLGRGLENTLLALGKWGSQFVPVHPENDVVLNPSSYALTLKTFFRAELAQEMEDTYELHIDNEVLRVHIHAGKIEVMAGEAPNAVMKLYAGINTYLGLLAGAISPDAAVEQGLARVEGNREALDRFLKVCGIPAVRG